MTSIYGIDPGFTGAAARIAPDSALSYDPLPVKKFTTKIGRKTKTESQMDMQKFVSWASYMDPTKSFVFLELPDSAGGQNKSSGIKLLKGLGQMEGILTAFGVPWAWIKPKDWQQLIWGLDDYVKVPQESTRKGKVITKLVTDTKATSVACARRLWSDHDFLYGVTEKRSGPARTKPGRWGFMDAALIAAAGKKIARHSGALEYWQEFAGPNATRPYPGRSKSHIEFLNTIR